MMPTAGFRQSHSGRSPRMLVCREAVTARCEPWICGGDEVVLLLGK